MYTSIRRYNVKHDSVNEAIGRAEKGFVPIISKAPGFLVYDLVDTGNDTMTTISTFQDQAEAEKSNVLAADWVKEILASLITEPPTIMSG
jgi:hypothetical protein